jgi:hypothetical protein
MKTVDLQWAARLREGNRISKKAIAAHQPSWCGYPMAASGAMGCWSLWAGLVTGQDYCCNCEERKR